jgi:hypothetical protein
VPSAKSLKPSGVILSDVLPEVDDDITYTFTPKPGSDSSGWTYEWFFNNVAISPAVTSPSITITGISESDFGVYTVKVTNTEGTRSFSVTLDVVSIPQILYWEDDLVVWEESELVWQ